jgi:TPP-dependent pyruvate/acetoin dehydrogenase alpha subunit
MSLTKEQQVLLFTNLARACALDRMMMRVIRAGRMVGFYHEGGVALAPGVAAGSFLEKDDIMWPHYRAHAIAHTLSKGIDVKTYVAEHMGREAGCCKGRSSFHLSYPGDHVFGASGNIGANFPLSVGYGFAAKYKNSGQIVVNCSGDGSYGEGRAHEAMLMCSLWQLPVIFWCENNGIAQHSTLASLFPGDRISKLAAGYGMPSMVVDGQDLFACAEAALQAIGHARSGKGPIFVECLTLRSQEHNVGGLNNDGPTPRDQALMDQWKAEKDPLRIAEAALLKNNVLSRDEIDRIQQAAEHEADAMEAFSEASPKATPSVESLMSAVYAA